MNVKNQYNFLTTTAERNRKDIPIVFLLKTVKIFYCLDQFLNDVTCKAREPVTPNPSTPFFIFILSIYITLNDIKN